MVRGNSAFSHSVSSRRRPSTRRGAKSRLRGGAAGAAGASSHRLMLTSLPDAVA